MTAIAAGRSLYLTTLAEAVESLRQAHEDGHFNSRMRVLIRTALLNVVNHQIRPLSLKGHPVPP